MTSDAMDGSPAAFRGRASVLVALALSLVMVVSLPWFVSTQYDGRGDDAIYLLTTESMLAGEGYTFLGDPFVVRPPGFSALLMPVVAGMRSAEGGIRFVLLHGYVHCFGILASLLLFWFAKPRLGVWISAALVLAIWCNPGFRSLCNRVLSDVPGLVFLLGVLLADRRMSDKSALRKNLALGLLLAAGAYVRSVNLLLLPALVLGRLCGKLGSDRRDWGRFAVHQGALVGTVVLAMLPWNLRNRSVEPPAPAEELMVHSYGTGMWHEDKGDPSSRRLEWGEVLARVPDRLTAILSVLGTRMGPVAPGKLPEPTSSALFLGAAWLATWLALLMARRGAAEFFVGGLLLLVSVYFGFLDRLLLPAFVLLAVHITEAGKFLFERILPPGLVVGLICAGLFVVTVADWNLHPDAERLGNQAETIDEVCAFLDEHYPNGETLAAFNGRQFQLFLERPVHTLRFAFERDGINRVLEIVAERGVKAIIAERKSKLTKALDRLYPIELRTGKLLVYGVRRK